jgi:rhamnulokinase
MEATAPGDALIQARTHGAATGTLEELRARLTESQPVRLFRPS